MNSYLVTLEDVPGHVLVQADGFYTWSDGDLLFYRDESPPPPPPPPAQAEIEPALVPGVEIGETQGHPFISCRRFPVLAYAAGVWRTVMEQGAAVTYQKPEAQGRARESTKRRQKT